MRYLQERFVTKKDLNKIEAYLDKLFADLDIDVEFTKHFLDRANDERNKKQITAIEIATLFQKIYFKHGKPISKLGPNSEAILKSMMNDVNVPFVLKVDRKNGGLDLVAKTIMRKKNFKSPDKVFAVETFVPKSFQEFVLTESLDNPFKWEKVKNSKKEWVAKSTTEDGDTITFRAEKNDIWAMSFTVNGVTKKTGEATKSSISNVARIFATVLEMIDNFIKDVSAKEIIFTSDELSRTKLYFTLLKRFAKQRKFTFEKYDLGVPYMMFKLTKGK